MWFFIKEVLHDNLLETGFYVSKFLPQLSSERGHYFLWLKFSPKESGMHLYVYGHVG